MIWPIFTGFSDDLACGDHLYTTSCTDHVVIIATQGPFFLGPRVCLHILLVKYPATIMFNPPPDDNKSYYIHFFSLVLLNTDIISTVHNIFSAHSVSFECYCLFFLYIHIYIYVSMPVLPQPEYLSHVDVIAGLVTAIVRLANKR